MRELKARNDDQAGEIARLRAAVAVFEREEDGAGKISMRDSRIALKVRVQSLEAQSTQQAEIVTKLRSELAAANERLARQAAHFTGELKRLGSGTAGSGNRGRQEAAAAPARVNLAERVAAVQSGLGEGQAAGDEADTAERHVKSVAQGPSNARLGEGGAAARARSQPDSAGDADVVALDRFDDAATSGTGTVHARHVDEDVSADAFAGASPTASGKEKPAETGAGRPRLLDRIAGLSRSS